MVTIHGEQNIFISTITSIPKGDPDLKQRAKCGRSRLFLVAALDFHCPRRIQHETETPVINEQAPGGLPGLPCIVSAATAAGRVPAARAPKRVAGFSCARAQDIPTKCGSARMMQVHARQRKEEKRRERERDLLAHVSKVRFGYVHMETVREQEKGNYLHKWCNSWL